MKDRVLVSIITVSYNSQATIMDTLESILNQSYDDIEYILIDGKSKDNTVNIIKHYKEKFNNKGICYKWISEPDSGIYDAMNKGIKMCNGEIIGIVNSDDYLEKKAIEKVVQAYYKHPNFDIYHGDIKMQIQNQQCSYVKKKLDNMSDFKFNGMPVNHPATFVKKSVYERLGVFKTEYRNAGDYEFILRCLYNDIRFFRIFEVLSNMRDGGQSDDFITTFKETRRINIYYGYNYFLAWYRYINSIIKAKVNKQVKKNRFMFSIFYKNKEKYSSMKGDSNE